MRDPARYAQAKTAANRAYAGWAATHPASHAFARTLSASITGLDQPGLAGANGTGSSPPDATGAIGPNHYIEMVNAQVAVYSRSTLASPPVAQANEDAFSASAGVCDGQIKWDQGAQRFEYYSLDCSAGAGTQRFNYGWSKTADPTDLVNGWCKYHVATGSFFDDYGKLGNNDNFMIVGANQFDSASPPAATGNSPIFAIPKPANGSTTCPAANTVTEFPTTDASPPEPANLYGSSATGYVVAGSNSNNSLLHLYTVTGLPGGPVLTAEPDVTVPTVAVPAGVPQPTGSTTNVLDSSDLRLTQANAAFDPALNDIGIWTQHTVAGPGGGPSVVRWYELQAGATAPVQTGTVAVAGEFAFNGAISPDTQGSGAAINYSVGGSDLLVQIRAQIHAPGSAPGLMSSETTLAASAGVDDDFTCPTRSTPASTSCRWGDYAGASPDPNSSTAVWGTNQANAAPDGTGMSAQWLTNNFSLQIGADELPTAAYTPSTYTPAIGQTVSFNGTASNDPDGTIATYRWAWGDGTPDGSGPTPTHVFTTTGTHSVGLYVTDSDGKTAAVGHGITVGDELPTAAYTPSTYTPAIGQTVSFNGTASNDPDGTIATYRWAWGDGTPDGSGPTPTHVFTTTGTHSVGLYVTDSDGKTAAVGHGITVVGGARR